MSKEEEEDKGEKALNESLKEFKGVTLVEEEMIIDEDDQAASLGDDLEKAQAIIHSLSGDFFRKKTYQEMETIIKDFYCLNTNLKYYTDKLEKLQKFKLLFECFRQGYSYEVLFKIYTGMIHPKEDDENKNK